MTDVLSREQIEQIQACLDDGSYTKQEQRDFTALCDMALSALDNAEDAERYRWLRKHRPLYDGDVRCEVSKGCGPCEPDWTEVSGKKLDAAIDAARRESHD